jgi:hypothetical protein
MKSLATLVILGLMAASAPAAEISSSTMASIGLPGFAKMSQADAKGVRGKGYVIAISGSSTANFLGAAGSTNAYSASESGKSGSHAAAGSNGSFALGSLSIGSHTISLGVSAGGTSAVSIH